MNLYTEEGRRAYAAEAAKLGDFTLESAARLINDNQVSADDPHIDGELLAVIEAQLPSEIAAAFFVDRAFYTAETLVAAHPGMRGKDPRQFFDRLEIGVLLEKELKVGAHFRGANADARAVIARYETRVHEPNPAPFAFQYSSLVKRTIAREPDHVFCTRVYTAGAGWDRFLQLESLICGLVEYEPRAAARILGPIATAVAPLALTAGCDESAPAAVESAPVTACATAVANEAAALAAAIKEANEAIKEANEAATRVDRAVCKLQALLAAVV